MIKFAPSSVKIDEEYELLMVEECKTCNAREEATYIVSGADYIRGYDYYENGHVWIMCVVCRIAKELLTLQMDLVKNLDNPTGVASTMAFGLLKFYSDEELEAFCAKALMDVETLKTALVLIRDGWSGYFEIAMITAQALNS